MHDGIKSALDSGIRAAAATVAEPVYAKLTSTSYDTDNVLCDAVVLGGIGIPVGAAFGYVFSDSADLEELLTDMGVCCVLGCVIGFLLGGTSRIVRTMMKG